MGAWFVNFSIWAGDIVLAVLAEPIMGNYHLTHSYFSFLLSLPIFMMVLLGLPVGVLIAKLGPKKTAILGLLIAFLAQVVRGLSPDTLSFTLCTLIYGVGMAVVFPNLPKIAESAFPPEQQALASGVYMSGLPSGAILGLIASTFLLVGGILWHLTARELKEEKVSLREGIHKVSRNRLLWLVSVANLTLLITYFGATKYFPSQEQLRDYLGTLSSILVATISVALILGLLLLPSLSRRIGEKKALVIYQLLTALLLPLFAWGIISHSAVVWGLAILSGVLLGGTIPLYFAYLSRVGVERRYFGIASGIFVSVLNIGGFAAPILSQTMDDFGGIFRVAILFS